MANRFSWKIPNRILFQGVTYHRLSLTLFIRDMEAIMTLVLEKIHS